MDGENVTVTKKGDNLSVVFEETQNEYLVPVSDGESITSKVSVGDFIDYDAGIWTQDEIDRLKQDNFYSNGSLPCANFQFGGFINGKDRNVSINGSNESNITSNPDFSKGWKVLSINEDEVKIVSAGTPEAYAFTQDTSYPGILGGDLSEYILLNDVSKYNSKTKDEYVRAGIKARDFSMYENNLAVNGSAHCMNFEEAYTITNSLDATDNKLRNIGAYYLISRIPSQGSNQGLLRVYPDGSMYSITNIQYGIRIVITLKGDVKIAGDNTGDGSSYEKAWKISL